MKWVCPSGVIQRIVGCFLAIGLTFTSNGKDITNNIWSVSVSCYGVDDDNNDYYYNNKLLNIQSAVS